MARVFISHSSQDDSHVSALEAWLKSSGFDDLFVDHSSINAGQKWADALRDNAGTCRVVVCFVTKNWLSSPDCFNEFLAAYYMGKWIIPLFLILDDSSLTPALTALLDRVRSENQGIDLRSFLDDQGSLDFGRNEHRANLIRLGLRAAGASGSVGLDPAVFEIDSSVRSSPFPGLTSFGDDDADAAIFYGRSLEIAEVMEVLRSMRASAVPRPLVIMGASGSGKSSLLKAGVIPRLRRQTPAWIVVRAFRPGTDALLNFSNALSRTLSEFGMNKSPGAIRQSLYSTWAEAKYGDNDISQAGMVLLQKELDKLAHLLRKITNRPGATLLLSVDQAEELAQSQAEGAIAFADYLRASMETAVSGKSTPWRLAFTVRTDSYGELQRHPRFRGLPARIIDLRPLPLFRFDDIIERPALRYGVNISPDLVETLMEATPDRDALPLLAFAMQRLWDQFASTGVLTKDDYDHMGRMSGLIGDAAERALCGIDPPDCETPLPVGGPPRAQLELAEHTFIPSLADINEEGAAIRSMAMWNDFTPESKELLTRFDRWRLIVRKVSDDLSTVEVAHEALFREWDRLREWLEPERMRLEASRALQIAANAWDRNKSPDLLVHFGERLKQAAELSTNRRYSDLLGERSFRYLAACSAAENTRLRRVNFAKSLVGSLTLGLILGLVGWINQDFLKEEWRCYSAIRPYVSAHVEQHVLTREKEDSLAPVKGFRECDDEKLCPTMVSIQGGTFLMGSKQGDKDERYVHQVALKRFAISQFEVTWFQWLECVKFGECTPASRPPPTDLFQPVVTVSWHHAKEYVLWLSKITGKPYRLPSESEWEYAARGGTTTEYSFDDAKASLCDYANFLDQSAAAAKKGPISIREEPGTCDDGSARAAPVGSYKPNPFNLYDMHGNVWEWVEDCYKDSYQGAPSDGSPMLEENCIVRAQRGGGWDNVASDQRSAERYPGDSGSWSVVRGFRVARSLEYGE